MSLLRYYKNVQHLRFLVVFSRITNADSVTAMFDCAIIRHAWFNLLSKVTPWLWNWLFFTFMQGDEVKWVRVTPNEVYRWAANRSSKYIQICNQNITSQTLTEWSFFLVCVRYYLLKNGRSTVQFLENNLLCNKKWCLRVIIELCTAREQLMSLLRYYKNFQHLNFLVVFSRIAHGRLS